MVRTEAVLTQLVFEHSLRIRLIAETQPKDGSLVEASKNSKSQPTSGSGGRKKPEKGAKNLVGKINNLVTTDLCKFLTAGNDCDPTHRATLANITQAKEFLILFILSPVQICLSMAFLYYLLGWRCVPHLAAPEESVDH